MKTEQINISILEDHQGIIDGYLYRLSADPQIKIGGIARFGEDLNGMLLENPTDVLILDIEVPTSLVNPNPFPIVNHIPILKDMFPNLAILVISSHTQRVLVERLFQLGVSGYIFKNDHHAVEHLAEIIAIVNRGGAYFSQGAFEKLRSLESEEAHPLLTQRQLEALSLCVAFPDNSTTALAKRLDVSPSTFRNLLSSAYKSLGVKSKSAAIAELQRMGIGPSDFYPVMDLNQ